MSAFDKIAKKPETSTRSKDKVVAETTPEIQTKVDLFVANKAELKRLEADQAQLEATIIDFVRPQQDELAYCGSFTKSLSVPGATNQVTFVTMDKFSVPQDEEPIEALKKLVGKNFDTMFETKRTIKMKDTAAKDEATLTKIASACEKAGLDIASIFDVGDKYIAKDDLDRKQYEVLKPKQLIEFRSLVHQAKPALK